MPGKLKIHVDQDKCQGHSRCKSLAPELFELDEFGNAHEIGVRMVADRFEWEGWRVVYLGPSVPPEDLGQAAADRCPRAWRTRLIWRSPTVPSLPSRLSRNDARKARAGPAGRPAGAAATDRRHRLT